MLLENTIDFLAESFFSVFYVIGKLIVLKLNGIEEVGCKNVC